MNLLLVEDDKEIVSSLMPQLKERGFAVDVAFDGEEGLGKAQKNDYDIIILDKGLPKKDGLEVCSGIRSAGKHMPILILSVKSEIDTKADLLNAGADDYMTKPFSFKELMARLNALLRRPEKVERTTLRIGDITVDIEGRTVTRGNKKLHLTTKEFSLLEYFLRNRGKALLVVVGISLKGTTPVSAQEIAQKSYQTVVNLPADQQEALKHTLGMGSRTILQEALSAKDLKALTYDEFASQGNLPPDPDGKLRTLKFLQFARTDGMKVILGIDENNMPVFGSAGYGNPNPPEGDSGEKSFNTSFRDENGLVNCTIENGVEKCTKVTE